MEGLKSFNTLYKSTFDVDNTNIGGKSYMRSDKNKTNKPAAAIIMCFCLMALVSILTVKAGIDKVKESMETADVVKKQSVEEPGSKDIDSSGKKIIDSRDNQESGEETESKGNSESMPDHIFPVEGDIIMEHSMDVPVYWKTLDQYMVHSGIDIAADADTPVMACADGTVTKIEENDSMGVTVEINHGNEFISVYSNLSQHNLIELGEVVTQGTVIGRVGQTSLFEFDGPDHLHFEMKKNNEPVDPTEYLK